MKKLKGIMPLVCLITYLLFGLSIVKAQNTWIQKASVGAAGRSRAVGFAISDKGYICTGGDNGNGNPYTGLKKDLWEYDPISNTWAAKTNYPGNEKSLAIGFSIGTKGYVGMGAGYDTPLKDFFEYDPSTNSWVGRAFYPINLINGIGFSIGSKGYAGIGGTKDFYEYNPTTNLWTKKTDYPGTATSGCVGFSIGGKGYVGLGNNTKDFYEYNPTSDTWFKKTDFAGAGRSEAVGFSLGGKGYVGTGKDANSSKNDFWEYDPIADSWIRRTDVGGGNRSEGVGFSINNKGYIGAGTTGSTLLNDFWVYSTECCPNYIIYQNTSSLPNQTSTKEYIRVGDFGGGGVSVNIQNESVVLKAKNSITLEPGTTIIVASQSLFYFSIYTEDCSNPAPLTGKAVSSSSNLIYASVSGGIGPFTYQWNNGQSGQSIVPSNPSPTTVTVTDVCTGTSIILNVAFARIGILEETNEEELQVFPNPSTAKFSVSLNAKQRQPVNITVYDVLGRRATPTSIKEISQILYEVDLHTHLAGMYLIRVSTDKGIVTKKIILEH